MTLPAGWRMERLGIISAVLFTKDNRSRLLWVDGEWWVLFDGRPMRARGVPHTTSMKRAERIGAAWIIRVETEDEP